MVLTSTLLDRPTWGTAVNFTVSDVSKWVGCYLSNTAKMSQLSFASLSETNPESVELLVQI